MKTIQMTIDEKLLKLVDKVTRGRRTTRSALIRGKEAQHAAGYADKPMVPGEFDIWADEQDWGAS